MATRPLDRALGIGGIGLRSALSVVSASRLRVLLLAVAFGVAAFTPPGVIPLLVAALATIALATDRRLGAIGATIAVVVAIPYGRGADVSTFEAAGLPVRPADVAIAVGIVLVLGHIARVRLRTGHPARRAAAPALGPIVTAFVIVGVLALGIGILDGAVLRDVARDARWWGLYVAAIVAALVGTPRRGMILRGVLLGATVLAIGTALVVVLPTVPDGLKDQALTYDRGTLRMQFGNSIFLVPVVAWVAAAAVRRPRPIVVLWLTILVVGITLTLTRTTLIVTVGVVALTCGWAVVSRARRLPAAAVVGVLVMASVGLGLGLAVAGQPTVASPAGGSAVPEQPVDRITFQSDASSIETTLDPSESGRLTSYRNAIELIGRNPILGAGLGSTVDVPFAYNTNRASTIGRQPGVDDAYLTMAMKSGAIGLIVFAALLLWPLAATIRQRSRRWFLPAWLGILALTITQSFAVSGYAPFVLGCLVAYPALGYASRSGWTARDQV